jgi:hypothetical protein
LWLTASVLFVSSATVGLLTAQTPAWAADPIQIRVTEAGFSPNDVPARVGDYLIFTLDQAASIDHPVSWDDNSICPPLAGVEEGPCWPELRFNDENQKCSWRNYVLPRTRCILVRKPGEAFYYDKYLSRPSPNHYHGMVRVAGVSTTTSTVPPTSSTTVVPPSTTTTTLPPTTATTAPTTTTTAPTSIRPLLVSDPPPTTTTTAAPTPAPTAAPTKNGGASASNAGKDKGKGKSPSPATPTTAAPAPPDTLPSDLIFDPSSLTPGPTMMPPTTAGPDAADEAALDASAVASLLDPQKSDDGRGRLMLLSLGVLALLLVAAGVWAWLNRASRYDPA